MAYKNKDGQVGTLFKLLSNVSNPILLSEEELTALGITKFTPEVVEVKLTLEEYKIKHYNAIAAEAHDFVVTKYPYYKQLSALNGTYDEATCTEIKEFCDKYVKLALTIKDYIFSRTTKKAINAVYFRDVEIDIDGNIVSETFWSE